jgi:hypothetical protein
MGCPGLWGPIQDSSGAQRPRCRGGLHVFTICS